VVFLLLRYGVAGKKALYLRRNTMETFLHKYSADVTGVLNGFDRLVLRGTLRKIVYPDGMKGYLHAQGVLLKEFGKHVQRVSTELKEASTGVASENSRQVIYLESSRTSKEAVAREAARKDGVDWGLICVIACVEPCYTFDITSRGDKKKLGLVSRFRKCLHLYHYFIHPLFGFMHGRIQTWFPFNIQICLNGREWLARLMDQAGLSYVRKENCFSWIEDIKQAQSLMDSQLKVSWPKVLDDFARQLNPAHDKIFSTFPLGYYWSVMESEWATDVIFRSPQALGLHYRTLVHHGVTTFSSPDVMRFLGKNIPPTGRIPPCFAGEVVTDLKHRPEGIRIKHRLKSNAIKLYDKQGSVLRVETTINDPSDFKVYRKKESGKTTKPEWLKLRKGVADVQRRAQVSQAANERYLEALASAHDSTPLKNWTDKLCRPVIWKKSRFRALNPYSPADCDLLKAVAHGQFSINGFRNKDLRDILYGNPSNQKEQRRASAAVTRRIRLLRAHGLIQKVPKCHRYQLTNKGRLAVAALLTAREADAVSLTKLAA